MAGNSVLIKGLKCEYLKNPLGIDVIKPRLSWRMECNRRGAYQAAYQVLAAGSEAGISSGEYLWDSGKVESDQCIQAEYHGPKLRSGQRVYWKVRVWDETGTITESKLSWWEVGLLNRSDWRAKWIGGQLAGGPRTPVPLPYMRKKFVLEEIAVSARLYVSALGLVEPHLNGKVVGDDVLFPGWTNYHKRVQYRVYDVTNMIKEGHNVLGAVLGDGWYCGHVGWRDRGTYGDRPKLLAQLRIDLADGSTRWVVSDATWKIGYGPLLEADLIMGTSYDARREMPGWDTSNFEDQNWPKVEVFPNPEIAIVAAGTTVKRIEDVKPTGDPVGISQWPDSRWIYDLGQNMVGRVRIKASAAAGTGIQLRFAEVLNPDGTLYTTNLRSARQTDYYTFKGDGVEEYEFPFTFHGFRYVEVRGFPEKMTKEMITGVVLHSEIKPAGTFECSEPLLNQLQHNIQWGQKGNYVDVPTDCPQRDERLGWTGDAQVFIRTATFNFDVAAFFTKWLQDMEDAQTESGSIPSTVPDTDIEKTGDGGPAWADAFLICPWTIYQAYADQRMLAKHYAAYKRFINFLIGQSKNLIRCHPDITTWAGFGDWLALDGSGRTDGGTPKDLIGTAFLAYSTKLMSKIANQLGKVADQRHYARVYQDVKRAFNRRFVTQDGLIIGGTQTAYVLALQFDLIPEKHRAVAMTELTRDIEKRGMHLSTGFVGASYLPHVLSNNGRLDMAYALLNQKTWPSWLYAVTQGATTIWERWDGWTHERGFQDPGMNSFNHYAYGAIGEWIYAIVAGIDLDEGQPGFKHIIMKPRPGGEIKSAKATYDSIHGEILSDWKLVKNGFDWKLSIPANTTATIHVPGKPGSVVSEGDKDVLKATGVQFVREEENAMVYLLQSGSYHFKAIYSKS
jgi:alpha-L-rhamnosidase